MGDNEADGVFISGQLECLMLRKKSVSKWHKNLSCTTDYGIVLWQAIAAVTKEKS